MKQKVEDLVSHILVHVNAEDADSDLSQVGDVRSRAAYVRSVLQPYSKDARKMTKGEFLNEVSTGASVSPQRTSFRRLIDNVVAAGNPRPRLAIQEWVGKGIEGEERP